MIITISLVILYHHIKLQNVQHKLLYMLYIISPRHLFYNWKLVPLDPLHPFCPASLSSSNHHPTVYIHIEFAFVMFCLFICFNCQIPHLCIFIFLWLINFTQHIFTLKVHPCCLQWQNVILKYGWAVFHCVYVQTHNISSLFIHPLVVIQVAPIV